MWPTTTTRDYKGCGNAVDRQDGKTRMDTLEAIAKFGPPAPESANTPGSRREYQGEAWATATVRDSGTPRGKACAERKGNPQDTLCNQLMSAGDSAKLNPRWVETLMGLPLGWTSPDAPASLIRNWKRFTDGWSAALIEQTSCGCAETESSLRQQKGLLECSMESSLETKNKEENITMMNKIEKLLDLCIKIAECHLDEKLKETHPMLPFPAAEVPKPAASDGPQS